MSAVNFIKFLHKKGVLSNDQLLVAIDKALNSQKSMIKFLMDKKPNKLNEILELCIFAIEDQSDLISAQKKHNLFDSHSFEDLMNQFKKEQKSISNILLSEGMLNAKELESLILEFAQPAEPKNDLKKEQSQDSGISEAALESLRELAESGGLDPEILAELESEKKK